MKRIMSGRWHASTINLPKECAICCWQGMASSKGAARGHLTGQLCRRQGQRQPRWSGCHCKSVPAGGGASRSGPKPQALTLSGPSRPRAPATHLNCQRMHGARQHAQRLAPGWPPGRAPLHLHSPPSEAHRPAGLERLSSCTGWCGRKWGGSMGGWGAAQHGHGGGFWMSGGQTLSTAV